MHNYSQNSKGELIPTISQFYGIKIYIHFKDHNPPHFHALYAENEIQVNIKTGEVMAGTFPLKARLLVEEWRLINIELLLENWELMIKSGHFKTIKGLE